MDVTLSDIRAAQRRIAGGVIVTPCPESIPLSEITGARIVCKLDNFQRTGSFKERGARNALSQLTPAARRRGVVAASAGNHALGLAYHGRLLGIPVTVVMPDYAPLIKITTCQKLGARVLVRGRDFAEARAVADGLVAAEGLTYIHGFDDPAIIAGQGTLALEVLRQVPDVDAIVCPVGGGGLLAGVAVAVKALRPRVQVIGVESAATGNFGAALRAGGPVRRPRRATLADGLATLTVGANAFALARDRVDAVVAVPEADIALAILRMLELEKTVVEGAAAVPLAAMMAARGARGLRRQHRPGDPQPGDRERPRARRAPHAVHGGDQRPARRVGRSRARDRGERREHQGHRARPRLQRAGCERGQRGMHRRDTRPRARGRAAAGTAAPRHRGALRAVGAADDPG
jgi:threonine dehydratase